MCGFTYEKHSCKNISCQSNLQEQGMLLLTLWNTWESRNYSGRCCLREDILKAPRSVVLQLDARDELY